ncbi:gluconokinase [Pedobacter antarcticus]|uniref:gluconokinase n=1 Tax=Pedobacter antarcticus TaxID=34086 RepID=UPI00292EA0A3|nr:gluconokinase [Pedobacter antarcticus]
MEYILGIDIGTGSTKGVAVDLQYKPVGSSQSFYPTSSSEPGYSEQDPLLIWEACCKVITEQINLRGRSPKIISLSCAMHSLIAADSRGEAIIPMMTWADNRAADFADELLLHGSGTEIYLKTGTPVHAMSPLCKIGWIRIHLPEVFSRTEKFISIKEYIWFKLFGVFEIDHSVASCTGLMNLDKLCWYPAALTAAGIQEKQLSELVSTTFYRTFPDAIPGMEDVTAGIPVVIGATDGCLANLGTGAVAPGIGALTIGTSGALRVAAECSRFNKEAMTFSYRLDEKIYINGGPVNNGGIALKWQLKNMLGTSQLSEEDYETAFCSISDLGPGADGLLFLPYLQGERAPVWDARSCGVFFGLRLSHTPSHMTRAVIEGICFALEDVLNALQQSGQQVDKIHVSGGFVSSSVWLQILADITGKELVMVSADDASAIGAALLAAKATGLASDYPLPDVQGARRIYPDKKGHQKYMEIFEVYVKLYPALKEQMHRLHNLSNSSADPG